MTGELSISNVERLFDGDPYRFVVSSVESDDRVVEELDSAAVDLLIEDLFTFLDLVSEDNLLRRAEELKHGLQLS